MAEHDISGKKVAFLLTDGVEQIELTSPWEAVKNAGGQPVLVSPKTGTVQGFDGMDKGETFTVDLDVADADANDFDALVLPGGVVNADFLRGTRMPSSLPVPSSRPTSLWHPSATDRGC